MPKLITLSLDVTLLDKARFKTITRKNGKQAVFADLVLIETPDGQYGDWMVKQGCTKEEREARVQMPILGNGKTFAPRDAQTAGPAAPLASGDSESSEVPF